VPGEFDAIVIGAGPAGEVTAAGLAAEGLEVVLVERELVGGECAFYACMPSKALLRPAELLAEVRRVPGAREATTGRLDPEVVLSRRDEVVHDFDDTSKLPWIEDRGIALLRGQARLDGELRVRVGDELLQARRAVVLAVGSGAAIPPVPGLREIEPWTSRCGTVAEHVPRRLTVLGGGVVGCELAQAWSSLGSKVTLVEARDGLLADEEPFAGEELAEALTDGGVDVRLGAEVTGASRDADDTSRDSGDHTFTLTLKDGSSLVSDELLVAVGRRPHTGDLGLESVGLAPGETIAVDDRMRVPGRDWLYAVGDVNGRALLTHAATYQAKVAVATIMNRDLRAESDGPRSPRVVFTDPSIAAVGLTLNAALAQDLPARAVDAEIGSTPAASFVGKGAPSKCRLVIDTERDVIIGATFTGPQINELLHAATIAIVGEVPLERLVHAIPAFPTRTEVWLRLLDQWQA
jgi:pyruvate/2-oxoglutarate dehydrogenase complex dihydrolipoamide dehydrogenase (E3) component